MSRTKQNISETNQNKRRRPALDPEAREQQLIAYAVDLVEQRLLNGTASSQETTHFLKLGSTKSRYELEKLERENELLRAKTESLQSAQKMEEMYAEAMAAFRGYSGMSAQIDDEDDEYDDY